MAGVLDEFDDATPLRGTFCSRLSVDEYEEQASSCTKQALAELMDHLDENPQEFKSVLRKRKRDEDQEESGMWAFVKMKLMSLFGAVSDVSDDECQRKLESLKQDMMKAFNYAQESKGRRYSRRLAEKEVRRHIQYQLDQENQSLHLASQDFLPAPPPPPPPPPPLSLSAQSTPVQRQTLTRRPLTEKHNRNVCKVEKRCVRSGDARSHDQLLQQLKGSECRKRLRKTACRSPGRTPLAVSRKYEPDLLPFFNAKLSEKFRNTASPDHEQSPRTLASPGAFGSPM